MSMIEVDPKLFITCRLCLEEMGHYQIVPAVQNQIKYCFDIDVEPFDGLPQLICKKCEVILSDYFTTKKTFTTKQNDLKTKLGEKLVKLAQPQQETVSSSQQNDSETVSSNQVLAPKKRKVHIPSTSSDTYSARSDISLKKGASRKIAISSWELGYNKLYGCKLCNRQFRRKCDVKKHGYSHKYLREKYHYVLNNNCILKLKKLDGKPNLTGKNTVMHGNTKIIEDGDVDYYIIYVPKQLDNILDYDKYEASDNNLEHDKCETSDDTDEDFFIKRKRNKRRLISKSSNDTVVIETNDDNKSASDDEDNGNDNGTVIEAQPKIQNKSECIHIDDSSDNSSDKNDMLNNSQSTDRKKINAKFDDYKTIQNIISMCQNKYKKRVDVDTLIKKVSGNFASNSESQLKHKVLSIGRKVVNKQSAFNCTGILRFMEYKNLELVWVPKTPLNCPKDTYYVRILTKIKSRLSEIDNSEVGWTDLSDVVLQKDVNVPAPCSALDIESNDQVPFNTSDSEVIYNNIHFSCVDQKNKLLNANPVANPKQLPKKAIHNEMKCNNIITISTIQNTPTFTNVTSMGIDNNIENNDNLCMPIITSTTSLAPDQNETEKKYNEVTVVPEKCETQQISKTVNNTNMPRIKVKPVSELMPEKVLKNIINDNTPSVSNILYLSQQTSMYSQQETIDYIPGVVVQNPEPQLKIVQVQGAPGTVSVEKTPASITVTNSEYVILDTVELPNTKTAAPFKYLANLLQIHNITLLDTNVTLSQDFICLIKFKVLYKQESKDQPVVLCLSLFCHVNVFCIKVKDKNQEDIDMSKISANWQWEILKIFKADVVQKLLQNAQKVSQEVFEYTKSCLCLIKSINFTREI